MILIYISNKENNLTQPRGELNYKTNDVMERQKDGERSSHFY